MNLKNINILIEKNVIYLANTKRQIISFRDTELDKRSRFPIIYAKLYKIILRSCLLQEVAADHHMANISARLFYLSFAFTFLYKLSPFDIFYFKNPLVLIFILLLNFTHKYIRIIFTNSITYSVMWFQMIDILFFMFMFSMSICQFILYFYISYEALKSLYNISKKF